MLAPWKKSYDRPRQHIKKQRHYFANKGLSSQSCGFSSSHVWMLELDYKESWVLKNWCFWTVVLEKIFESSLNCKEIQPVHPKGNSPEYSLEGLMLKLKLQYFGQRPWCWERLNVRGEGDGRGWDGWMASPTRWIWVWVSSGSWWWTGKPGVLQSTGLQSQIQLSNWTELNWTSHITTSSSDPLASLLEGPLWSHWVINYPHSCINYADFPVTRSWTWWSCLQSPFCHIRWHSRRFWGLW